MESDNGVGKSKVHQEEVNSKTSASGNKEPLTSKAKEFFKGVSIAGVKHIVSNDESFARKGIWASIVVFSFVFTVYQIHAKIQFYLSYPTAIDIRMKYETELRFPTVTICNVNRWNKSHIHQVFGGKPEVVKSFLSGSDSFNFSSIPDYGKFYADIAHRPENTIKKCRFRMQPCSYHQFKFVPTTMGFCFRFNTENQNFHVQRPGYQGSLQLMLFAEEENAISGIAGFRVSVHGPHESWTPANSFSIGSGFLTTVFLSIKESTELPNPFGDCVDRYNYTASFCYLKCEADYIIKHCRCKFVGYPGEARICSPQEIIKCAFPKTKEASTTSVVKQCACPHECRKMRYSISLSSLPRRERSENTTSKSGFAYLNIAFSELSREEIVTMAAYDTFSLICDIGGALSLLLGTTLITILEVLDFTLTAGINYIVIRFKQRIK